MNTYRFSTNASAADVYTTELQGTEYLVVPAVALVEGVLNGELVPLAEIENTLEAWNGRPVVIRHPTDGKSAATIGNYINHNVGMLFNPRIEEKAFKVDMYVDIARAGKVNGGEEVVEGFLAGEVFEVSTGYWATSVALPGEYNGVSYNAEQRDITPDHLAILPDEVGACSIQDGCGAPRLNKRQKEGGSVDDVNFLITNESISFGEIFELLDAALRENVGEAWITDIFDDRLVYEVPTEKGWVMEMRSYSMSDGKVALQDDTTQVRQRRVYVERREGFFEKLASAILKRNAQTNEKEHRMEKIDLILNSGKCPFTREELEAMPETALDKLARRNEADEPTPQPEPQSDCTDEVLGALQALATRMEALEARAVEAEQAETASVTNALVAAGVQEEALEGLSAKQLKLLANSLAPNYEGIPAPGQRIVANDDEFEALEMPSLNGQGG